MLIPCDVVLINFVEIVVNIAFTFHVAFRKTCVLKQTIPGRFKGKGSRLTGLSPLYGTKAFQSKMRDEIWKPGPMDYKSVNT